MSHYKRVVWDISSVPAIAGHKESELYGTLAQKVIVGRRKLTFEGADGICDLQKTMIKTHIVERQQTEQVTAT